MSGLESVAFLIGVAGLFSSCVDAFSYFKLAQHADKDIEIALLKLDIEKTRLLIWGEKAAVFSADDPSPQLLSPHARERIPSVLEAINALLTDSDALRATYGMQNLSSRVGRAVDYISAKSVAAFRSAGSRYWIQKSAELPLPPQRGKAARTKWAIYDREKFQHLVHNLKDFIDTLFELTEFGREAQDRRIIEDIKTILDISQLTIIEEATESSHRAYSEIAASTRALTESGTVDRRTLEERLREVEGVEESGPSEYGRPGDEAGLDSFCSEVKRHDTYFVLTSTCRRLGSQNPCDSRQLGFQAAEYKASEGRFLWDISSRNSRSGNALWQLIGRLANVKKTLDDEEHGVLGGILKVGGNELSDTQEAYLEESLPLQKLYIYCAPCVCLIHTALNVGNLLSSRFIKILVRPDDRLLASCWVNADRALGLRNIIEEVREWEATAGDMDAPTHLVSFLDRVWLDHRLDHLDYETPYTYEEEFSYKPKVRILAFGEADYLGPLVQRAPGRIPIPMDIWHWMRSYTPESAYRRTLFGRFIESRFSDNRSTPNTQATPQQQTGGRASLRRPSSPIYRAGKRLKSGSANSGGEDKSESENESSERMNQDADM